MQSKSEKSSFSTRATRLGFLVTQLSVLVGPSALALSVAPVNGGTIVAGQVNSIIYYAVKGTAAANSPAFMDTHDGSFAYREVDPTFTQLTSNEPIGGAINPAGLNMLVFDVTIGNPNPTPVTGSVGVITVSLSQFVPPTTQFFQSPIAWANGAECSEGSNCYNQFGVNGYNTGVAGHLYAATVPTNQSVVRIGFYPADLCADYLVEAGGAAPGCNAGAVALPTSPTQPPLAMAVQFAFAMTPTSGTGPVAATPLETQNVTIQFEESAPTLNCPDPTVMQQNYSPGDGEIILANSGIFGATIPNGGAPSQSLVVVGSLHTDPPSPDLSAALADPIVDRVPIGGGTQNITGFVNYDVDPSKIYDVSFLVRDSAGMVTGKLSSGGALGTAPNFCTLENVETSTIQSYLGKSRCFIATAAFRSMDAEPVVMLRQFRDEVLNQTELGGKFVQLYYLYSPSAANWLLDHPAFETPVLSFLLPVEIIAYAVLHPLYWLATFLGLLSGLLFYARVFNRRTVR